MGPFMLQSLPANIQKEALSLSRSLSLSLQVKHISYLTPLGLDVTFQEQNGAQKYLFDSLKSLKNDSYGESDLLLDVLFGCMSVTQTNIKYSFRNIRHVMTTTTRRHLPCDDHNANYLPRTAQWDWWLNQSNNKTIYKL